LEKRQKKLLDSNRYTGRKSERKQRKREREREKHIKEKEIQHCSVVVGEKEKERERRSEVRVENTTSIVTHKFASACKGRGGTIEYECRFTREEESEENGQRTKFSLTVLTRQSPHSLILSLYPPSPSLSLSLSFLSSSYFRHITRLKNYLTS
jgi:hypothetical protein